MRARLLVLGALLAGSLPVVGMPGIACAGEGPSAALVVDTGSATTTYCVSLGSDSVTGIELVQLAGEQHGLEYSLGFGGRAVCMLEGVGPTSDDCFEDYPDFWGYWQGDGSGGWRWSSSGAASSRVEDGDVEGWSWGSGQDGRSHQRPPSLTFTDVCGAPSAPPAKKAKPKDKKPASSDPGSSGGGLTEGAAENDDGERVTPAAKERSKKAADRSGGRREREGKELPLATPSPTPDAREISAAPTSTSDDGGPPAAGLAALGFSVAAGLIAALLARRRRGTT